jgi:hypothetical protein
MKIFLHQLLIHTSIKHFLLQTFETALALQFLDTLSDVRIKAFMLLFEIRHFFYLKTQAYFA